MNQEQAITWAKDRANLIPSLIWYVIPFNSEFVLYNSNEIERLKHIEEKAIYIAKNRPSIMNIPETNFRYY